MVRIVCESTGVLEIYEGGVGLERLVQTIEHDTIEYYTGTRGKEYRTSMESGGFIHYYTGPDEALVRVADATTGQSVYWTPTGLHSFALASTEEAMQTPTTGDQELSA